MNYFENEIVVILLCTFSCFSVTFGSMPIIIKKMIRAGLHGVDVNKIDKPEIPEMGGVGGFLGFSLGITFSLGIIKYFYSIDELPVLITICVLSIAAFVGLLDDVSILGRKEKAWFITFASLPLLISQMGPSNFDLIIFHYSFPHLFFWLIIVPLAVTGCANAINMSAGYNGLESGQIFIISFSLLIVSFILDVVLAVKIIFAGLIGVTGALFYFNRYPAKIFIGDIGTLGFGSVIASAVVMSGTAIYGVICLLPTFYELISTLWFKRKGIERREACMNPVIDSKGVIKPLEGASNYTLCFFLLSRFDLTERNLVRLVLFIYFLFGLLSIVLSYFLK